MHTYMKYTRIILDCDGVVADFVSGLLLEAKKHNMHNDFPSSPSDVKEWNICDRFLELFNKIKTDNKFWLNLPRLSNEKLTFRPLGYLTARPCDSFVTRQWVNKVGLPDAEVYTVKNPLDKIAILKDLECDVFVDDHIETVEAAIDNGINAILFSSPYQRGHSIRKTTPIINTLGELDKTCRT